MFKADLLAGKVAVVTGAGTGIGAGISESLVGAGAAVVVAYHSNTEGAEQLAERLRKGAGYSPSSATCASRPRWRNCSTRHSLSSAASTF